MPTFRGALRTAAATALFAANTIAGDNVLIEADWPVTQIEPAISVTARRWRYDDRTHGTGIPQFWATIRLGIECRAAQPDMGGTGRNKLVIQLDELSGQVEGAMAQFIIGPPQLFRRITAIEGEMWIDASGTQHQGALDLGFGFEYAADAETQITTLLQEVSLSMVRKLHHSGRFGDRFGSRFGGAGVPEYIAGFLTQIRQP